MSTDEVYGSSNSLENPKILNPANPYSASKAAVDMIVNAYVIMYPSMTIATLRSNNIAGPGQFIRNIIPRFTMLGLAGQKMTMHGDGSASRRYLWVRDAAAALKVLAERCDKSEIYNIGHETHYSNLQVAEKIGAQLGLRDFISFEKDRLVNDVLYPSGDDRMTAEFGWQPTRDLDDFLPETVDWYKDNFERLKPYL